MQLTKEQIERNEAEVAEAIKEKDFARFKTDEATELLRGYRAYLAAVHDHEEEIKFLCMELQHLGNKHCEAQSQCRVQLGWHRCRLEKLQKGAQ